MYEWINLAAGQAFIHNLFIFNMNMNNLTFFFIFLKKKHQANEFDATN